MRQIPDVTFMRMKIRLNLILIFLFLATLTAITISCRQKEQQKAMPPPVPVIAGSVSSMDVPVQISATGAVEASSTVAIKAQVGGILTGVHFTEGQDVHKGDLLFTIDPRPYEAALKHAEATLARDSAQLAHARAEEKRYADLVGKGYVSQTQYEQVRTDAEALSSVVEADRAQAENARLQLSYCTIRSPLSGRTGTRLADEGNLIKANADTPLVTINRIDPVHVNFSLPEKSLAELRERMKERTIEVEAFLPGDAASPVSGRLTFIENTVDTATGTIPLRAVFDNAVRRLWPGQFVRVVITLAIRKNALIVPLAAVQTGQSGQFVFVIKDDLTVEMRPVNTAGSYGELSVIEKGLSAGERVVTDGQLMLMPGRKVAIQPSAQSQTSGSVSEGQSSGETGK